MNLIFHQAALGDFILTFPLLRAAREPTVVVAPWSKAALAARLFDHVSPMDIELWEFSRLHVVGGPTSVSPAVEELFSGADRIISFISKVGDPWADNVARLAPRATIAHVQPRPPAHWSNHLCDWHRDQLAKAGFDWPATPPHPIQPPSTTTNHIVIHPGSGGRDKCWPIARFETVISQLQASGRQVTAVLGEAELERWSESHIHRWRSHYQAHLSPTLDEFTDLLQAASHYLGNDAGPTHLAAQLNLHTIALFGPSDPRVWAPVGPNVTVLAPPTPQPMDWLTVDAVVAACQPRR